MDMLIGGQLNSINIIINKTISKSGQVPTKHCKNIDPMLKCKIIVIFAILYISMPEVKEIQILHLCPLLHGSHIYCPIEQWPPPFIWSK